MKSEETARGGRQISHDGIPEAKRDTMVNVCYYPGCGKKQKRYNPDSFHRLPLRHGRTIVNRWLVILNIDINTPTEALRQKNYRVCSAHFNKDDFSSCKSTAGSENPLKTYLKKNAVPRVDQVATDGTEVTFSLGWGENTKDVYMWFWCKPQTQVVVV